MTYLSPLTLKYIFVISTMVIALIMSIMIRIIKKTGSPFYNALAYPMSLGVITNIVYSGYLQVTKLKWAILLTELYFISTDFLTLFMMIFAMEYTGFPERHKRNLKKAFTILCIIDTVSLLLNSFTKHLFNLQEYQMDGVIFWSLKRFMMHSLHLFDCYVMVVITFVLLIIKCHKTTPFYKSKYLTFIISYLVVLLVNMYCYMTDQPVDFSILLYPILAAFISYSTIYFAPKVLINKMLVSIYDTIKDAVIGYNPAGNFLYANKTAGTLFDSNITFNPEKARIFYKEHVTDIDKSLEYYSWNQKIDCPNPQDGETQKEYKVEYQKLYDHKVLIGSFLNFKDRTKEMNRIKREHYISTHDDLTGIYNRAYFFESVKKALSEKPDRDYLMLCSNIKDFKLINELFGQDKGNEVLKKQAELLVHLAHESTIFGRIGDDKFGVFMEKDKFDEEKFTRSIEAMRTLTESSIYQMHIYIGVYEVQDKTEKPESMYDKAHMAIENIRDDYQKIFAYYNTDLMDHLLAEKNVVGEFEKALDEKQFVMYLQGQFNTKGKSLGAEALVRWIHPTKGLISPGYFIPVLENTGLIYRLDQFIWEEAAKKLSEWKKQGFTDRHISVNISAKDFFYVDIYQTFVNLVNKYDISPSSLKIEITETVLMTDFNEVMELFHKLQDKGFEIEIDDFGSGYSSLNMLKDIKANVLKIDMGFLRETENHEKSRIILETIISMSKALKMAVVCEGVETIEQTEMLTSMGCDIFQGFYFSKPIPAPEYEEKFLN